MGRRSSGGRSARAPARAPARKTAPKPVNRVPPPAPVQNSSGGSVLGAIGSTVAEGMAFGTGNAVAHRAVDAIAGPRTFRHETVTSTTVATPDSTITSNSFSDACGMHSKAFQDCIYNSGNDISKCQFYMDMLSECRKNSGLAA